MKIEEVQVSDESNLEAMMLHTISTSVRVDKVEMTAVIANVLANMRWAFEHAQPRAPRNERPYLQVNAAPNAVAFYTSMGFAKVENASGFGTSTPMALLPGAK